MHRLNDLRSTECYAIFLVTHVIGRYLPTHTIGRYDEAFNKITKYSCLEHCIRHHVPMCSLISSPIFLRVIWPPVAIITYSTATHEFNFHNRSHIIK